jgi:hypothetical protein
MRQRMEEPDPEDFELEDEEDERRWDHWRDEEYEPVSGAEDRD